MTTAKVKRSSTDTVATARDPRKRLASVARRVTGALGIARSGARMLIERLPGTGRVLLGDREVPDLGRLVRARGQGGGERVRP